MEYLQKNKLNDFYKRVLIYFKIRLKKKKLSTNIIDDIAQNATIKVWKVINKCKIDNIVSFLEMILNNSIVEYFRSKYYKAGSNLSYGGLIYVMDNTYLDILSYIKNVGEKRRKILLLRYSGYTYKEIELILNTNYVTIYKEHKKMLKEYKLLEENLT